MTIGWTADDHEYGDFTMLCTTTLRAVLLGGLVALLTIIQADTVSAGTKVWTSNGPESGTIQALAIDAATPSTLYAGTRDGGVFAMQQIIIRRNYLPIVIRGQ